MRTLLMVAAAFYISTTALRADSLRSSVVPFAESLQRHHISLEKSALVKALSDNDPDVRSLAALQLLIEDRALDALPQVERTLAREEVMQSRLHEAFALANVGDEIGIVELKRICDDGQLEMLTRVEAATYLLQIGRESCFSTVLEALSVEDQSSNSRQIALALVPRFRQLTEVQSRELTRMVVMNLTSDDPAMRLTASHALAAWGRTSAIADLRLAIDREDDASSRPLMEQDLQTLVSLAGRQR